MRKDLGNICKMKQGKKEQKKALGRLEVTMEFLSVIDILLEIFKWCESVDVLGFSDWFSCWINFSMASQLYHVWIVERSEKALGIAHSESADDICLTCLQNRTMFICFRCRHLGIHCVSLHFFC